jgi:hypothetical protein
MTDISKFKDRYNSDEAFFLFNKNNIITERYGIWGRYACDDDPMRTIHHLYHYHGIVVDDTPFTATVDFVDTRLEGIEIIWDGNPFKLNKLKDYYNVIKYK